MELKTNYSLSAFSDGTALAWKWPWERAGNGENGKEEKEVAMGHLRECEGLLGFNLCSRMGQSVGKGTEEEREWRT